MKHKKLYRLLAVVTLFSIIIYGILKIWVLQVYAKFTIWISSTLGLQLEPFFEIMRNQAEIEAQREHAIGWLIYYPSYFLLHILFIYLLFANNKKVRNYLMIGLTAVISLLIGVWIIAGWLELDTIAYAARKQFRNLFGLPFILLAIEGGRILYTDIVRLMKE